MNIDPVSALVGALALAALPTLLAAFLGFLYMLRSVFRSIGGPTLPVEGSVPRRLWDESAPPVVVPPPGRPRPIPVDRPGHEEVGVE